MLRELLRCHDLGRGCVGLYSSHPLPGGQHGDDVYLREGPAGAGEVYLLEVPPLLYLLPVGALL